MGFNKRIFNIDKLAMYYRQDPINGITNCVGRTEGFIFEDEISHRVIDLWSKNREEEANKILEEHVLRIADKIS